MLIIEILEYVWEHKGSLTFDAIVLFFMRKWLTHEAHKILHLGREGEIQWILERLEQITGERYDGRQDFSKLVRTRYIKNYYSYLRKGIELANRQRRVKTMLQALTSSFSKKLAALIITAAISSLNKKFGLDLSPEAIYGLYGVTIAYIAGQSHVDAKKLISKATNSIAAAVTESAATIDGSPIQTITAMPMSYNEMLPYLQDINKDLTDVYDTLQRGRYNDQTQHALNIAMTVHEYLKSQNKGA